MRVVQFPQGFENDPRSYIGLLTRALNDQGVEVDTAPALTPRWAWRVAGADVVHLHWLEFLVNSDKRRVKGHVLTAARGIRLLLTLGILRRRGIGVVWTVHNLVPHEQAHPWLDRALATAVAALSVRVIAHSRYARARVAQRYRCGAKTVVIPHGNYIGIYPDAGSSRAELRHDRGIAEGAFVFLAFGQIRPYKRLTDVVAALGRLDDADVRLLIGGAPAVAEEATRLRRAATADERVMLELRRISDFEVVALHRIADAAVIAYRDVFSSGALLLALSLGLPVVAPERGSAAELVLPSAIETFEPEGLADALERMRRGDSDARARAAIRTAESFPWRGVAAATVAIYADATQSTQR